MSKTIFDMGKNLKDYVFDFSGFKNSINFTNQQGDIKEFPKKRGRPKMKEVFFHNPNKEGIIVGVDPGFNIGNASYIISEHHYIVSGINLS